MLHRLWNVPLSPTRGLQVHLAGRKLLVAMLLVCTHLPSPHRRSVRWCSRPALGLGLQPEVTPRAVHRQIHQCCAIVNFLDIGESGSGHGQQLGEINELQNKNKSNPIAYHKNHHACLLIGCIWNSIAGNGVADLPGTSRRDQRLKPSSRPTRDYTGDLITQRDGHAYNKFFSTDHATK